MMPDMPNRKNLRNLHVIAPEARANDVRLTRAEAAALLGLSVQGVARWVREERFPEAEDKSIGAGDLLKYALEFELGKAEVRCDNRVRQLEHNMGQRASARAGDGVGDDLRQSQVRSHNARAAVDEVEKTRRQLQLDLEKGVLVVKDDVIEIMKDALTALRVEVERLPGKIAAECHPTEPVPQARLLKRLRKIISAVLNNAGDRFVRAGREAYEKRYAPDGEAPVRKVKPRARVKVKSGK